MEMQIPCSVCFIFELKQNTLFACLFEIKELLLFDEKGEKRLYKEGFTVRAMCGNTKHSVTLDNRTLLQQCNMHG